MLYSAVIFDFNGTLFWDTPYHNRAWDRYFQKHGLNINDEEKRLIIHGKSNRDIFENLLHTPLSENELHDCIMEKEGFYQEICLEEGIFLAEGAVKFFEYLSKNSIPYTIATSSGVENVDFFFEKLILDTWFDRSLVVYNTGIIRGKPFPDTFLKAYEVLGKSSSECLVFEDSYSGIEAAENSGAGGIIIVNSHNADYSQWDYPVIETFLNAERFLA